MATPTPSTAPDAVPSQAPTANVVIVPDDDPRSGEEPAFLTESDAASSTLSLSSSVLNYQWVARCACIGSS